MNVLPLYIRNNIELRFLQKEHAQSLFVVTRENYEHLKQWLGWLDDDKSVADVESYIVGSLERFEKREGIDWLLWEGDMLIGGVALYPLDMANRKTSLMYWLSESHEGKGIMTDTLQKVIEYIFTDLNLHRIEVTCAVGNTRSSALPNKLGFTFEGIARESCWLYDHFVDLEVYSLLQPK